MTDTDGVAFEKGASLSKTQTRSKQKESREIAAYDLVVIVSDLASHEQGDAETYHYGGRTHDLGVISTTL